MKKLSCASVLAAVLLLSLTGCVTSPSKPDAPEAVYSPQLQPGKAFAELKQDLETALRNHYVFAQNDMNGRSLVIYRKVRTFRVGDEDVVIDFENAEVLDDAIARDKSMIDFTFRLYYSDFGDKPLDAAACKAEKTIFPRTGSKINFVNYREPVGFAVCNALYNIGILYKKQQDEGRERFREQAAQYRALTVKPKVSEEQRRLIIQAESRREKKDYARASELYREVVKVDAVSYPAAYFNLALLSEQLKRYNAAIACMKQYLELVPDAKDARSAQDKIYEWEELLQK